MIDILFRFKLNLNPETIKTFLKGDETKWNSVIQDVIPTMLKGVFSDNTEAENFLKLQTEQESLEEIQKSSEYNDMVDSCETLITEYFEVVKNYDANHGILWQDKFLKITKTTARKSIQTFLDKYRFLQKSVDSVSDDTVNGDFKNLGQYGHGKTAIILYKKVVNVLEEGNYANFSNMFFIYDKNTENILVPSDYGEPTSKELVLNIEDYINSSDKNQLGNVTIIPIYDEYHFRKIRKGSAVHVQIVYPNGPKQSTHYDEILGNKQQMDDINAAAKQESFFPDKSGSLNEDGLAKRFKQLVTKGYVRGVWVGSTNILVGTLQKTVGVLRHFSDDK